MLDHYGAEVYSSYIMSQISLETQQRSERRLAGEMVASAGPVLPDPMPKRRQRLLASMLTTITRTFREAF
jgi:hypothetical protein